MCKTSMHSVSSVFLPVRYWNGRPFFSVWHQGSEQPISATERKCQQPTCRECVHETTRTVAGFFNACWVSPTFRYNDQFRVLRHVAILITRETTVWRSTRQWRQEDRRCVMIVGHWKWRYVAREGEVSNTNNFDDVKRRDMSTHSEYKGRWIWETWMEKMQFRDHDINGVSIKITIVSEEVLWW